MVRSTLGVAERWYDTTALDDLLGVDTALINDTRLYRALDQVGAHKEALCAHLMERYRQWFGVRFEFLLYDVTTTYFEGEAARNPQAQRGYSRDQLLSWSLPFRSRECAATLGISVWTWRFGIERPRCVDLV